MTTNDLRKAYIKARVENMLALDNMIISVSDKVERDRGIFILMEALGYYAFEDLNITVDDISNAYIEAKHNKNLNG